MTRSPRAMTLIQSLITAALLLGVLVAGCTPKEQAQPVAAPSAVSVAEIASSISPEHGSVIEVHEGSGTPIVVFQEMHNSILQQTQIAAMLNTLYVRFGLRTVGLEGASLGEFSLPDDIRGSYEPSTPLNEREDAAVQLLANGEISAPELLAILYRDISIEPIETSSLYDKTISVEDSAIPFYYLALVALSLLPEDEQDRIRGLSPEEFANALFDAIDRVPLTKEIMDEYGSECSCKPDHLDRITDLAVEQGVATRDEVDSDLAEIRDFLAAACSRGEHMARIMTSEVSKAAAGRGEGLVAITSGAAHCEIPEELSRAGHAYVVIRPASFDWDDDPTVLSTGDWERKDLGLPIVSSDTLRQALSGSLRKPPSVIGRSWMQAEGDACFLVSHVAREVAGGRIPPLDVAALNQLVSSGGADVGVGIVPGTLFVDDGEVVFAMDLLDENRTPTTVWVRAVVDRASVEQTLQERLDQLISDLADGTEQGRTETATSGTTAVAVSSNVKAAFCESREVAESIRLSD